MTDWRPMLVRVGEIAAELKVNPPPLPKEEIDEAVEFLEWLAANNFTFLGARDYVFTSEEAALQPMHETGLGLLRPPETRVLRTGSQLVAVTPEIRAFLKEPKLLIVTKSAVRSRVHRRIAYGLHRRQAIRRRRPPGRRIPHRRPVHLHRLYALDPHDSVSAPQGRRRAGRAPASTPDGHSGKALANVLETYSRDELFQIDEDTLYEFAMLIMQLDERPRVRVLARRDRFDRFVSIFVFVPRDRYNSTVRAGDRRVSRQGL